LALKRLHLYCIAGISRQNISLFPLRYLKPV
jgi:hypothetical protein